jgi:hypothetical protein
LKQNSIMQITTQTAQAVQTQSQAAQAQPAVVELAAAQLVLVGGGTGIVALF